MFTTSEFLINFKSQVLLSKFFLSEVTELGNSHSEGLGFISVVGFDFSQIHEEDRLSIFLDFWGPIEFAVFSFELVVLEHGSVLRSHVEDE